MDQQELQRKVAVLEDRIHNLQEKFITTISYHKDKVDSINEISDIEQKIAILEAAVESLEINVEKKVSVIEFGPIRTIVYTLVGLILTGVIGGLLRLLIK